jgi:hypothetical protein
MGRRKCGAEKRIAVSIRDTTERYKKEQAESRPLEKNVWSIVGKFGKGRKTA